MQSDYPAKFSPGQLGIRLGEPVVRITRVVTVVETVPVSRAAEYYNLPYPEDAVVFENQAAEEEAAQHVLDALNMGPTDNIQITVNNTAEIVFPWVNLEDSSTTQEIPQMDAALREQLAEDRAVDVLDEQDEALDWAEHDPHHNSAA